MKEDIKDYINDLKESKKGFVKLLLIVFLCLIIPVNLFTINLIVIGVLSGFKIYDYFVLNTFVDWNAWPKESLITVLWVSGFYLIIKYLGGYGLLGFILIVFLLAGFKVWKAWAFFRKSSSIITRRLRK